MDLNAFALCWREKGYPKVPESMIDLPSLKHVLDELTPEVKVSLVNDLVRFTPKDSRKKLTKLKLVELFSPFESYRFQKVFPKLKRGKSKLYSLLSFDPLNISYIIKASDAGIVPKVEYVYAPESQLVCEKALGDCTFLNPSMSQLDILIEEVYKLMEKCYESGLSADNVSLEKVLRLPGETSGRYAFRFDVVSSGNPKPPEKGPLQTFMKNIGFSLKDTFRNVGITQPLHYLYGSEGNPKQLDPTQTRQIVYTFIRLGLLKLFVPSERPKSAYQETYFKSGFVFFPGKLDVDPADYYRNPIIQKRLEILKNYDVVLLGEEYIHSINLYVTQVSLDGDYYVLMQNRAPKAPKKLLELYKRKVLILGDLIGVRMLSRPENSRATSTYGDHVKKVSVLQDVWSHGYTYGTELFLKDGEDILPLTFEKAKLYEEGGDVADLKILFKNSILQPETIRQIVAQGISKEKMNLALL